MARFHVSVRHEGKETAAFGPYLTRRSALVDAKILARRLKVADEEADSIQPIKKEHEEIGYKLEASQGLFKFLTVEGASRRKNPHPPLTRKNAPGELYPGGHTAPKLQHLRFLGKHTFLDTEYTIKREGGGYVVRVKAHGQPVMELRTALGDLVAQAGDLLPKWGIPGWAQNQYLAAFSTAQRKIAQGALAVSGRTKEMRRIQAARRKNTGKSSDAVVSEAARIAKEFGRDAQRRGATSILDISVDGSYQHWLDAYIQMYPLRAADIMKVVHRSWREGYRESGDASGPRPLALRKNAAKSNAKEFGQDEKRRRQAEKRRKRAAEKKADARRKKDALWAIGWKYAELSADRYRRAYSSPYEWPEQPDDEFSDFIQEQWGSLQPGDMAGIRAGYSHGLETYRTKAATKLNPHEKRAVEVFELKSGGYDVVFGHKDKSEFLVSRSKPRKRYKTYKGAHAAVTRWVRTGK